jgi:gluconolactonase
VIDYQVLASGYGTIEGPTVDTDGNLYFSDVFGGGVYRRARSGEVELFVPRRKGVGGICLHADGGIVVAGRDLSHVREGSSRTILGRDDWEALGLTGVTGFNDIHADDRGRVLAGSKRADAGTEVPGSLVLVTGQAEAQTVYSDVDGSNGLALDWNSKRLFHSASFAHEVIVSTQDDTGAYLPISRFSTSPMNGVPDGLALDAEGCPWVAFYDGGEIVRFSPDGEVLRHVPLPATRITSLCFVSEQDTQLIVVTEDNTATPSRRGSIFQIDAGVAGAPVGLATV